MDNVNIKSFLESIDSQTQHDSNKNDNAFNVFSLCQVWHKETIHSAILASLLDPKGEHGLGTMPLKLFFAIIGINLNETQLIGARVTTEKTIEVKGRQRRLDILITGKNLCVIIENKTITCDHEGQLDDYYDWLYPKEPKEENANLLYKKLLYLTYNGNPAVNVEKAVYTSIAYNRDITEWLDKCANEIDKLTDADEIEDKDFLKKTIVQYKDFLKKLTEGEKMDIDPKLAKAIIKNFSAADKVAQNIDRAKAYWIWTHVLSKLQDEYGFYIDRDDTGMYRDNDVYFGYPKENKGKKVIYAFDHYGFNDPRREIYEYDEKGNEIDKRINKKELPFKWNNDYFKGIYKESNSDSTIAEGTICKIVDDVEKSIGTRPQKLS